MSDTPETDAFLCDLNDYSDVELRAMTEHARKLERERDEARRQYDDLATEHVLAINKVAEERDRALMDRANGDMATMTINHYERILREQNEAKADAARIADILSGLELRSTEELARLEQERNEAREQLRKASVEANTLATSIQKAEYPDAKEFELLGSVAGVISQIDNMYAGVRQQRDEWRKKYKLSVDAVEIAARLARAESERDEARQHWGNESMNAAQFFGEKTKAIAERDEARAVADELASVASHCLGWHEHKSPDAAIKIAAALKRWKKSK